MNKIRQYFSTLEITRGFFISLLGSLFIYLEYFECSYLFINTFVALLTLYLLLKSTPKVWFFYGFFSAFFWFWWIGISFIHYHLSYLIPLVLLFVMGVYGFILWVIAWISHKASSVLIQLLLKTLFLLLLSYIHPFGFDWFKPELLLTQSYLGILKWQFATILCALTLFIWQKKWFYLLLILFAYSPNHAVVTNPKKEIALISTHIKVADKWNKKQHAKQFEFFYEMIDDAITSQKSLIILPESVFPIFLKSTTKVFNQLKEKSKNITIVAGGLSWENNTPHNSTYLFKNGEVTIANKVILVPFGESNPLPKFLSDWVNKVFYDGAVDYVASAEVTDFKIKGKIYRNAICFEATSEALYKNNPQNMIIISNNGWFTPSIEPTLQKILLLYYHRKYGTTFYHSINMSDSYSIRSKKPYATSLP